MDMAEKAGGKIRERKRIKTGNQKQERDSRKQNEGREGKAEKSRSGRGEDKNGETERIKSETNGKGKR